MMSHATLGGRALGVAQTREGRGNDDPAALGIGISVTVDKKVSINRDKVQILTMFIYDT